MATKKNVSKQGLKNNTVMTHAVAVDLNKHDLRIAIAGAGGIGGFVARGLYEYGFNRGQFPFASYTVDVFDNDTVDTGNLLHQDFTEVDLGQPKAQIMADRYSMNAIPRFMTEADFSSYDVVFSCVDSMTFRYSLYHYGFTHPGLLWIDGRCSSRTIAVYHEAIPRSKLEDTVNNKSTERAGCLRPVDKEKKLSHVTPQIVAGMMVQTFLNKLRKEVGLDYPLVVMI
jgi:hypothetical protein